MNCTLQQSWRHSNQSVSDDPGAIQIDDFQWADHSFSTALDFSMLRWEGGCLVLELSARTGTVSRHGVRTSPHPKLPSHYLRSCQLGNSRPVRHCFPRHSS